MNIMDRVDMNDKVRETGKKINMESNKKNVHTGGRVRRSTQ
jgi:hypothetical protein